MIITRNSLYAANLNMRATIPVFVAHHVHGVEKSKRLNALGAVHMSRAGSILSPLIGA